VKKNMVNVRVEGSGWVPTPEDTPYQRVGGREAVVALVEAFYDSMELHEPALAKLHALDAQGKVSRGSRDRFALFLAGWLGGPQDYTAQHGHPRLRMRHAKVAIEGTMRDAWTRSMSRALEAQPIAPEVRAYLVTRFGEVAEFLRNVP
jgi:hemoglobin